MYNHSLIVTSFFKHSVWMRTTNRIEMRQPNCWLLEGVDTFGQNKNIDAANYRLRIGGDINTRVIINLSTENQTLICHDLLEH
jgi:hypothetical protein